MSSWLVILSLQWCCRALGLDTFRFVKVVQLIIEMIGHSDLGVKSWKLVYSVSQCIVAFLRAAKIIENHECYADFTVVAKL